MSRSSDSGEPPPSRGARRRLLHFLFILLLILGGGWWLGAQPVQSAEAAPAVLLPLFTLFLVLLCCSGLISSSETALFSLDKVDLARLRGSTRWIDLRILRLLDRPNDTLITILILNNFANIAISLTVAAITDRLLGSASAVSFLAAAVAATTTILLMGEIVPKMLAHQRPLPAARVLSPALAGASWLMYPLRTFLNFCLKGLYRLLRIPTRRRPEDVTDDELKAMISAGEVAQILEQDEREMIDGVFELRRTTVQEILTPRLSVTAVPDDLDQAAMLDRLRQSPNNRVLVYHDSPDELVGFLLVKEVLLDAESPWRNHLREPLCVPERVGLLDLLKMFRQQRTKMAVVVDEYGGVAGIVTLQDLLEEIVGDIYEKHEYVSHDIQPIGEGAWRITGSFNLEELADQLGITFPERMGVTLGGFVMNTLGRVPRVGDEVHYEGHAFRVEEMMGRRILGITVRREAPAEAAAPDQTGELP
ncbi:MAG: Magnesium and cobalt efflux protein CorC [candidate division BRC1 bacterium ADurb.BinA292]|nr:MAG: Magnesium and cobalt efflux protein CorC [candidate division BRC1 bacterium ADurb.BinA292]